MLFFFFQCIAATFRLEQQTKAVLEECCSSTCIKKILYLYSMLFLIALHKKTRVYKGFHSIFFSGCLKSIPLHEEKLKEYERKQPYNG